MSIRARFEDAIVLLRGGRHDGALLSALVALAATSRLRFPRGTQSLVGAGVMRDAEAFETLFRDMFSRRSPLRTSGSVRIAFRGELVEIERIFYRYLRCNLVHEAELPADIEIVFEQATDPHLMFQAAAPGGSLRLGLNWVDLLLQMVAGAPENATAFEDILKANPLPP